MMKIFIEDGNTWFVWGCGFAFTLFFIFNLGGILLPYIKKTIKFCKKELPKKDVPFVPLSEEEALGKDLDKDKV